MLLKKNCALVFTRGIIHSKNRKKEKVIQSRGDQAPYRFANG
jgi:hypothetical protein